MSIEADCPSARGCSCSCHLCNMTGLIFHCHDHDKDCHVSCKPPVKERRR